MRGMALIRDFLVSEGIPMARMRRRPIFTSYEQRIRLMGENAERPEEFRVRSLRRKLTPFDRALSDDEAYALDKAFTAWLILSGKAKSVDPGAISGAGGSSIGPLSTKDLAEARLFQEMKKRLGVWLSMKMEASFWQMAPWVEDAISGINILEGVKLARAIKIAYDKN